MVVLKRNEFYLPQDTGFTFNSDAYATDSDYRWFKRAKKKIWIIPHYERNLCKAIIYH